MNIIKIHKKAITLILIATFFYLIQITVMPLGAETSRASGNETMSSTGNETGLIEQEAPSGYAKKKSSVLPIIIGVVAVGAIAAVLVLVVFKTKYDITGTWSETNTVVTGTTSIVFSGDKKSGTVSLQPKYLDTGTYTVSSKTVHFEFHASGYTYNWVYDGEFDGKDTMSGTVKYVPGSGSTSTGTWSATRATTTAGAVEKKATMINAPAKEVK
jgi:hypothetical protein